MGFYTTSEIISQSLFLFFFRGGWAHGPQAQLIREPILVIVSHIFLDTIYSCDTLAIVNYGNLCYVYNLSKKLRESRKDNMSKETMRETINTIKSVDGMKAVKVAFDLSSTTMDSVTKVTQVVTMIDDNLKSLAIKVLELEKKLEAYERPKN